MTVAFKFFTAFVVAPAVTASAARNPNYYDCRLELEPKSLDGKEMASFAEFEGTDLLRPYTDEELSKMSLQERQSLLALANERIRKGNEMIRWQALAIEQRSRVKRGSIIKDKEALLNSLPGNQQERKAEAARILNTKAQEHKLISEQVAAVETSLEETFGRQTKLMIKAARQMGPNLDALRAVIVNLEVRISQLEEAIQTAQEESAGYERTIQSLREAISALETKPDPVDTV